MLAQLLKKFFKNIKNIKNIKNTICKHHDYHNFNKKSINIKHVSIYNKKTVSVSEIPKVTQNSIMSSNVSKMTTRLNHADTEAITHLDLLIYDSITRDDDITDKEILEKYSKEQIEDRKKVLISYREKLAHLKKLPLIKQRTTEWFNARKSRLTASDLDDAIKNNCLKLAKKKAGIVKDTTNYSTIPPLKWGTMFESMAMRCYSQKLKDIGISEFGLIEDEINEHFGASPDGINDMGIMIEIKCPFSRKIIDGEIPQKYFMQIQGQLAVCYLNECDYIECNFKTYDSAYKYIESIENEYGNKKVNHGIIAEYKNDETDEYEYLYSDPYLKASHVFDNINKQMNEYEKTNNTTFLKVTPWRLEEMNIQRVYFNEADWKDTLPKIDKFWEKVEECKLLPIEEHVVKTIVKQSIKFIEDDD